MPLKCVTFLAFRDLRQAALCLLIPHSYTNTWRRKWQPTPVFLPRESCGQRSLVCCRLRVVQSWTWLKRLSGSRNPPSEGSFHFWHALWFDNQNCFFCTSSKLKGHFLFPSLNASTKWKCVASGVRLPRLRCQPSYLLAASVQFNSVAQSCLTLSHPMDCSMPGLPVHHQLRSLLRLLSIKSVMPSDHLILCRPLLLLPSIFPSIRVFSNESDLHIRWPKY